MTALLEIPADLVLDEARDLTGGIASAVLDDTGTYRYLLTRIWDPSRPPAVWIMLNPSVADATRTDQTLGRTISFSHAAGAGGVCLVNLFALRSTDPRALRTHREPVGPHNDSFIRQAARTGSPVVAAWGAQGVHMGRAADITARLLGDGITLHCLGTTSHGQPRHPLYVAGAQPLIPYQPPEIKEVA